MSLFQSLAQADSALPQSIDRLLEFLRIPSISTDPAFAPDCERAANWLVKELKDLGFDANVYPTAGQPMVIAVGGQDILGPHILFYGHYDVQPVDPIDLWDRPPFDPAVIDTPEGPIIFGRGSSDDKGQLMTFIEACRAWKEVHGALPCKLTLFFEGEEESGSPSLIPFMQSNAELLKADLALICDTDLFASKTPAIVTTLRGVLGEEVTILGPNKDLHSGMFGGAAINPLRVLSRIIAGLHDEKGRITLAGFYDAVPELPDAIRSQWQNLAFDHSSFLNEVGLSKPAGEHDRTPLEMLWSRPTCEVNGLWGGYMGDGFKTVLPAKAHAKISFRLVGDQDPLLLRQVFRDYVTSQLPPDCTASFKEHGASPASAMEINNPAFDKTRRALTDEWGIPAAFVGCGGSIPIAGYFKTYLGMDALLTGFARANDQIHSPNEKYDQNSYHKGIRSWLRIMEALTK
ncbi:MAG: M20/M25/M40 family metallo-hydrolase [Paracoccaceae bacterium]